MDTYVSIEIAIAMGKASTTHSISIKERMVKYYNWAFNLTNSSTCISFYEDVLRHSVLQRSISQDRLNNNMKEALIFIKHIDNYLRFGRDMFSETNIISEAKVAQDHVITISAQNEIEVEELLTRKIKLAELYTLVDNERLRARGMFNPEGIYSEYEKHNRSINYEKEAIRDLERKQLRNPLYIKRLVEKFTPPSIYDAKIMIKILNERFESCVNNKDSLNGLFLYLGHIVNISSKDNINDSITKMPIGGF